MKISGMMTMAAMAITLTTGAAFAETASVSRCNYTEGATYKPALWITRDGVTRLVKVNEEGLTRRIIYSDKLAKDYVRAMMGANTPSSHVSITNSCSKTTYSNAEEKATAPVVAAVIQPVVVVDPVVVEIVVTTDTVTTDTVTTYTAN